MIRLRKTTLTGLLIAALVMSAGTLTPLWAADIPLMTIDELKKALDDTNVQVLDARAGKDWKASEFKIKGAIRTNPGELKSWEAKLDKSKKQVLYCA